MTRPPFGLCLSLCLLLVGCAGSRVRIPGPVKGIGQAPPADLPGAAAMQQDVLVTHSLPVDGLAPDATRILPRRDRGGAEQVARSAARFVGQRTVRVGGEKYRSDCSGFVAAAYAKAGIDIGGSTASLFERARDAGVLHRRRTPVAGDLAFFDNSYDRNRNGRRDDPLSHVAVVESIADDGTIVLVHYGSKGVARITMDLREPGTFYDDAGVLRNSILRGDRRGKHLTGQLFRAFGSMWQADAQES